MPPAPSSIRSGDDDFLARASKVALQPGVNWSEQTKGTNAIGTALIEEGPRSCMRRALHARQPLPDLLAAPILDPRGNILGVLDVTGDHRSFHQHTMALGEDVGAHIREPLATDDYATYAAAIPQPVEFIGTLNGGHPGRWPPTASCRRQPRRAGAAGLSGAALRMHSLTHLFGHAPSTRCRPLPLAAGHTDAVQLNGGRQSHIHARFNWPVWTSLAEAVSGGSATPATAAPSNASVSTPASSAASPADLRRVRRRAGTGGWPSCARRRPDRQRDRQDPRVIDRDIRC